MGGYSRWEKASNLVLLLKSGEFVSSEGPVVVGGALIGRCSLKLHRSLSWYLRYHQEPSLIPFKRGPTSQVELGHCWFEHSKSVYGGNQNGWLFSIFPELYVLFVCCFSSGAYVHTLVYVQAHVPVCTCVCGGQRTAAGCVLHVTVSSYCFEMGSLSGL